MKRVEVDFGKMDKMSYASPKIWSRTTDRTWKFLERPRTFEIVAVLSLLAVLILAATTLSIARASPAADIVALKTEQPFTLDGIPSENFWGQIPATYLPLQATTTYGGKVPNLWVKAAHNGTYIFLLLQWPDTKESRKSDRAIRLNTSTPGNLIGQYKANETYYYTDSASVLWWMGSDKPTVNPAINNEYGPSATRRATLFGWSGSDKAELWSWKSKSLDLGNLQWPDANLDSPVTTWHWGDRTGQTYVMNYSSAFQGLYNTTGHWVMGDGLLHARACQQPGTIPFEIRARGAWSSGMWTLEIARPLVPSTENKPYTLTLESGKTYWTVFGAFDGNKGEWEEVASMSNWVSIEVSKELTPQEKQTQTVEDAAQDAKSAAVSANYTAQQALSAAQQASKASQDARSAAEIATNTGYATIGLAVVAIAVAGVLGIRGRKPAP